MICPNLYWVWTAIANLLARFVRPVPIFNFMRCRTSYCQALDLCVQEIFLQSNLHCHLEKPQLFAVSRTDLLSSLEPNQCCYPECPLGKGCAERSIFSAIYTSTKNNRGFGWTVNKRESQLWQKMLGCFHASTEQIWADMSLDMSEKCHEMPTRSSENSQLVGTECLESSLQDTDTRKLQGVCGKDKLGNIIESCTSKKWGALEALLQMSAIGAAFGCSKACDIIADRCP